MRQITNQTAAIAAVVKPWQSAGVKRILIIEIILTAYSESLLFVVFLGANSERTICVVKVSSQIIAHIKAEVISGLDTVKKKKKPSRSKARDTITLCAAKRSKIVWLCIWPRIQ